MIVDFLVGFLALGVPATGGALGAGSVGLAPTRFAAAIITCRCTRWSLDNAVHWWGARTTPTTLGVTTSESRIVTALVSSTSDRSRPRW